MKTIYICSPLRGDIENNLVAARRYCRSVALNGHIPIAPHVYCTQFLDDTVPTERDTGMKIGLELLQFCDELWVFGDRISDGMKCEILEAKRLFIPVLYKSGRK